MKRIKIAAALLTGALLLSGCGFKVKNTGAKGNNFDLPPTPTVYTLELDNMLGAMTITIDGRTYTDFGDLNDEKAAYTIRDCLGYLEHENNMRVYTLAEDPDDNYIMVKSLTSLTGYTRFYRANDTMRKNIFTPSYIASLGLKCWCDSGIHYEQPEATVGFILNAENIKMISYEYKINGTFAGGGETGIASGKPYKKGELIRVGITEHELGDHADKTKPFTITYTFIVTDVNDNVYYVKGEYEREMMLGAYLCGLEIRGSAEDGFSLFEDI